MENVDKQGVKKASEFFKVRGDWAKQSMSLKAKHPELTNEDLKFESGKETELFKRLETKLGKNRNEIVSLLKTNQEAINKVI